MKTKSLIFFWLPRVICILAILFVSVFALDAFESGLTIWEQLSDFFMHMIPSFILLSFLIIAWKWEFIGGMIISTISLIATPFIFLKNYHMNHSIWMSLWIITIITIPFFVSGMLFMVSHFRKKII